MNLTDQILRNIGGKENITSMWHCMTRIRFNVKEEEKVNLENLENLDGVVGARYQNGQFQIIIGNNVAKVYEELESKVGITQETVTKKKGNIFNTLTDTISGVFNPILPAIVGAGLLKAILSLIIAFAPGAAESGAYQLFEIISDTAFYFLPFLLAASSARLFKVDLSLSLAVAGALMYPTILNNAGESLNFFGLTLPFLEYQSTVLPVILGVYLLKHVDGFVRKIIPEMFSYVFIPVISLGITIPLTMLFLAPAGNYVSVYFANMINWLFVNAAPVAGLLFIGLMPLIIMTGMHYAFFPSAMQSIQTLGYDIVLLPANLIHNVAQAGAAFGVAVKAKDKNVRSTAISTGISAIFGITEPAMYGVNLKYKKPFYAVMISGGIVGTIAVTLGIKSYAFATPGLLSLAGYISPDGTMFNVILAVASYIASGVLAFVITLLMKFEIEEDKAESISIVSPVNGKAIPLSEVDDKVFSEKMMGEGIAVYSNDDMFYAPFDGVVQMIFKTKHAVAIKADNGLEFLYHVGLETANLNGKYFEYMVEEGQAVKAGQLLLKIDSKSMKEEKYDLITPLIITNTNDFSNVDIIFEKGELTVGQTIMEVRK